MGVKYPGPTKAKAKDPNVEIIASSPEQEKQTVPTEVPAEQEEPGRPAEKTEAAGSYTEYPLWSAGKMMRYYNSGAEEPARMKEPASDAEPYLLFRFESDGPSAPWRRSCIPALYATFSLPSESSEQPSAEPAETVTRGKPAANGDAVAKKPAAAPRQQDSGDDDFVIEKDGMKACGPFTEKSYLLNGKDKRSIVNVSKHAAADHLRVVLAVRDWIKKKKGDVWKSEAKAFKDKFIAERG